MDEIDFDEVKEKGFIIEQLMLSNGSWVSVFEYADLYYYFDEVQELGPFEDYEAIDEMIEKIENHVNDDLGNEIVDRQVKKLTEVSFFNPSKKSL